MGNLDTDVGEYGGFGPTVEYRRSRDTQTWYTNLKSHGPNTGELDDSCALRFTEVTCSIDHRRACRPNKVAYHDAKEYKITIWLEQVLQRISEGVILAKSKCLMAWLW